MLMEIKFWEKGFWFQKKMLKEWFIELNNECSFGLFLTRLQLKALMKKNQKNWSSIQSRSLMKT